MLQPVEWKGLIEGYIVNYLTKHHWKIERSCPRSDAMQEAFCIFLRCKRKYPSVEPKHFMALFKTTWHNHFIDLSNLDTELRAQIAMPTDIEGIEIEPIGELDNDGMLAVMIRQAPREVSMVLSLFLNAPAELLDMVLGSWKAGGDRRFKAGGSEKINQLLGFPKEFDSMKAVSDYFKQ